MGAILGFKDLIAWRKSMELAEKVYRLSADFPSAERFGLASQARRAAVSIPSNIAEGYGRRGKDDYRRFLQMAAGSANELETQLLLAARLKFAAEQYLAESISLSVEVQKILQGLISSLDKTRKT